MRHSRMAILNIKRIRWTETNRLQLVEAVIKVEEEIMNERDKSNRAVQQTTGNLRLRAMPVDKWSRIAKLLPLELQAKTSSKHRCKGVFFELLKVYRDKLAGKHTIHSRRRLTKAVREILKKRQELLKALVWKRPNTGIHWTEPACLLLIEAVMRVEEEDRRKKTNRPIRSSKGRQMRKWERITNLLPAKLPGNCHRQKGNIERECRVCFFDLLKSYREIVRVRSKSPVRLTKSVFEMMKKRDDLLKSLNSIRDEASLRIALNISSTITRSRKDPEQDPEQLSQASNSFGKMHTTHEHFPEESSIGTATQPAAVFSTERINDFETTTEALNYQVYAEEEAKNDIKDEKKFETTSEVACSKNASGSHPQGSESHNRPAWSTAEISARRERRKLNPGNVVKLSPGVGHISKFSRVAGQTKFRIFLPCTRS